MDRANAASKRVHPKETASVFSLFTFFYTFDLFKRGFQKDLEEKDLYQVLRNCKSKSLGDQLELQWEMERKVQKTPSIARALWSCFGKKYLLFGVMQLVMRTVFVVLMPEALGKLVSYFSPGQTSISKRDAYYYAGIVIGFNFINFIYTQNYMLALTEFGIRIRTAICSLVYRKTLKMTEASLAEVTLGKIVTLITKDVHAVEMVVLFTNDIWIGFVQTALICYLIYQKIGVAAFAGVGFFFTVLPLQLIVGKLATVYRLKTSKKTDERLQLTQETLSTIKIIKMYAWEKFFQRKLTTARNKEVSSIYILFYLKIIIITIGTLSSKVAFYLLIMTYVWMGNFITAEIVYFIMSCFSKLRHFLSILMPLGITSGAEFYATLIRLNQVLQAEELPSGSNSTPTKTPSIVLDQVSSGKLLKKVTIRIEKGLNVVVGHVGSGKSTFLKTILGNYKHEGCVSIHGTVSYASQEPWLFPSSIRNNILFGENYEEKRYQEVLRICALQQDLQGLTLGDGTIVGDRGINLSKGQQARVNLARALYKESDVYLLDDCLSALDGRVSDYVYNSCIREFLRDKLCVFVTNNHQYIRNEDKVIEIGTEGVKYVDKPQVYTQQPEEEELKEEIVLETKEKAPEGEKLYNEVKKSGKVEWEVYSSYIKFGGGFCLCIFILIMFVSVQTAMNYSDKLVSNWVTLEQNLSSFKQKNLTSSSEFHKIEQKRTDLLDLYTILIIAATILSLSKSLIFFNFNRKASINLHHAMVAKILNATMHFFDSHFIGNVLNRFAKDLCSIDEHLPFVMNECFELFFVISGIAILVAMVNPIFLIPMVVFFLMAYVVRFVYQRTGRSLQRLETATRSPLMGHLSASLDGITTIRAFKAQEIIKDEFDQHQDLYTSANYTLQCSLRALAFILDGMCTLFITLVIARFLIFPMDTTVGNVGLAITQAFHLTGLLQYGIRRWADFTNSMTSVERVLEYTKIEQESKSGEVAPQWPSVGTLSYKKVNLDYGDRKVLTDLSFDIQGGEKIGVVGRTGAGKSSIISTLFRLYEVEGEITIDGVNTRDLPLKCLRENIAIIPQDPILFSGTIRENLDPFSTLPDDELWRIINIVGIKELFKDLDCVVDSNASTGQKQLICLARAIARKSKIVVLDEATANLDQETDTVIRKVIQEQFASCTVIAIAHRLTSIMGADLVLVVDEGQIVEKDSPTVLLENQKSLFYQMVKKF